MKYFKKAFQNADLTKENTRVYGVYKGYHMSVTYSTATGELITIVTYAGGADGAKERIQSAVERAVSSEKKPPKVTVEEHYVLINNPGTFPLKKLCQYAENYVETIIRALSEENCTSGCELCGGNIDVANYEINGGMHVLCAACAKEVVGELEANKQAVRADKSNFVLGVIGALIGSLIGVALWVIIWQLGYIAGIAGALMIVCAMSGYQKLGKALDVKGVIASFVISVIMIFVANQLSWSVMIAMELSKAGLDISFFEINRELFALVEDAGLMGEFIGELVIGYLLFIVAGISYVVQAIKAARGNYKVKKI